jgi:hypothetical protein
VVELVPGLLVGLALVAVVALLVLLGASCVSHLTAILTTLKGSWRLIRQLTSQQQQQQAMCWGVTVEYLQLCPGSQLWQQQQQLAGSRPCGVRCKRLQQQQSGSMPAKQQRSRQHLLVRIKAAQRLAAAASHLTAEVQQ